MNSILAWGPSSTPSCMTCSHEEGGVGTVEEGGGNGAPSGRGGGVMEDPGPPLVHDSWSTTDATAVASCDTRRGDSDSGDSDTGACCGDSDTGA